MSEEIAGAALKCAGWIVARTDTRESFDLVARDPVSGEWKTFQCKTILLRADRNNEMTIQTRKGNGEPYTYPEADYIIGVLGAKGSEAPRVWMFENEGQTEYWATEQTAAKRWVELPLSIQREMYA